MKKQVLIELSHGEGTALQIWERMCVRLRNDVVISGGISEVLLRCEVFQYATGRGEGEERVFTITEDGLQKAKEWMYAIMCGIPDRVGSSLT